MKKLIYFISIVAIFFSACTKSSKIILIDNPTDKSINFTIGKEDPIEIKANETKELIVLSGTNKIKIGNVEHKFVIDSRKDYMLNPSLSNYILVQTMYTTDNPKDKALIDTYLKLKQNNPELEKIPHNTIEIKGLEVSGNIKKTNDLLIEKIWEFGVNQTLPKQMKSKKIGDDIVKIYRETEYLNELVKSQSE